MAYVYNVCIIHELNVYMLYIVCSKISYNDAWIVIMYAHIK